MSAPQEGSAGATPDDALPGVAEQLIQSYPTEWPPGLREIDDEEVVTLFRQLRRWSDTLAEKYGCAERPAEHELARVRAGVFRLLDQGFLSAPSYLSANAAGLGAYEEALRAQSTVPEERLAEWRAVTVDFDVAHAAKVGVSPLAQETCERIIAYLEQCNPALAAADAATRRTCAAKVSQMCVRALDWSVQMRRCRTRHFRIVASEPGTLINAHQAANIHVTVLAPGKQMPRSFLGGKVVETLFGGLCIEDIPVRSAAGGRVVELPRVMAEPM